MANGPTSWMPWAMVVVFAGVSAVTAATTSLLFSTEPAAPVTLTDESSELHRLDRKVSDLQTLVRQLSKDLAYYGPPTIERVELPIAEGSPRGPNDEPAPERRAEDTGAEEARRGFGGRGGDRGAFDGLRALRSGTEEERLAAARELLAGESAMGQLMAIDVLIELSPAEGLAALKDYATNPEAAGGRGGDSFGRMLEKLEKMEGIDYPAELVALFDSGNESVQRASARALAKAGDDRLIRDLLASAGQGLHAVEMKDRLAAIDEISRLGTAAASGYLLPLLSDSSAEVRLNALAALRRAGDETAIAAIEAMLNDPVERVRENAEQALESIRNPRNRNRGGRGGFGGFGGERGGTEGGRTGRTGRGGRGGRGG